MKLEAVPDGPVEIPEIVAALAGDDIPVPVWQNTLAGLTFRLGSEQSSAGSRLQRRRQTPPPQPTRIRSSAKHPSRPRSVHLRRLDAPVTVDPAHLRPSHQFRVLLRRLEMRSGACGRGGVWASSGGIMGGMPRRIPLPFALRGRSFSVAEGSRAGLGRHRMRGRDLERPFHGVRVRRGRLQGLYALCLAYMERMRGDEFFCGATAARIWRIPLPDRFVPAEGVHVGRMAPKRASRARGVRGREFSDNALRVEKRYGLPVTDAASTWCHLAGVLSHDDLVAAGDHLILVPKKPQAGEARPYATLEQLTERAHSYTGRHARAARRALQDIREGAESRPETILRLAMVRAGLPEPELNVDIFSASGQFLGRGDSLFRDFRVIAEYDGEQHRTDSSQYNKDMLRIEGFIRNKFTPIRVRKGQLFGDPAAAVARVEGALRDAGWRP
ncbi:hypothetical protein [Agreia sp.]|uniref:hypothetical protein n=1 Tax=Agreia sp. TaxID=1872416 RepID=UPI0035BC27BF